MTSTSDWHPYCGEAPIPPDWLWRWNFDVALLMVLGAIGLRAWRIAEESSQRRMLLGAAGICLLLFISPFCALTSALFSARVAHHVILAAVLAPLIVHALPAGTTRCPGSLPVWTAVQAIAFWLWHAPGFYAAALSSDVIYWLMQVTITGTAAGFWAALRRSERLPGIAALLVTTVQMGLLGALITFAANPLYAPHFSVTAPWGLSPLEDQQMAGLIMWAPSAGLYLAAALWTAARWFEREERGAAT